MRMGGDEKLTRRCISCFAETTTESSSNWTDSLCQSHAAKQNNVRRIGSVCSMQAMDCTGGFVSNMALEAYLSMARGFLETKKQLKVLCKVSANLL